MQETITIKNRWSGYTIFQSTKTTWKEAVEEAVENGADLRGVNLRDADLYGAELNGADLRGADLREATLYQANLNGAELMNAKFYGKCGTLKLTKKQLPEFLNSLGFQVEN